MKDKFAKKASFPLGLFHWGHNFIFQDKEVLNTCNEFIDLVSAWENLIFGKDLWELEVTINERIKITNIKGGEKSIIIWFLILKLTFGLNFFFFGMEHPVWSRNQFFGLIKLWISVIFKNQIKLIQFLKGLITFSLHTTNPKQM